ncbi:Probable inorganic polyphosphate/ATP-NAD kinase [Serratia fonticola]|uniref:Probable inorganic polyphosphate/ATP-NAD kinase n=1 Tax=Serratia fonticola TaxID=47917 RepID=A0A4U9UD94_SERFO|nr:Probable inorganic polyphosphate/ATP-NAD kinase [Serratia fonticola]
MLGTRVTLPHWLLMKCCLNGLVARGYKVILERQIAHDLGMKDVDTGSLAEIGQRADLAVVVGGDGNMLAQRGYWRVMTSR